MGRLAEGEQEALVDVGELQVQLRNSVHLVPLREQVQQEGVHVEVLLVDRGVEVELQRFLLRGLEREGLHLAPQNWVEVQRHRLKL